MTETLSFEVGHMNLQLQSNKSIQLDESTTHMYVPDCSIPICIGNL